jgi:hypothetical protein
MHRLIALARFEARTQLFSRYAEAMRELPRELWTVFDEPEQLLSCGS